MTNKEKSYAETCIPYIQKEDKEHFEKMYPGIGMENKYILWLQFSAFWSYFSKSVTAEMIITRKDGTMLPLPKLIVRHMFPNHYYWSLCMKNGNKVSNAGVILHFDTFDALDQIDRIRCAWNFLSDEEGRIMHSIIIDYHVSFLQEDGKFNYSIASREFTLGKICQDYEDNEEDLAKIQRKLSEYTDIVFEEGTADRAECECFTGTLSEKDIRIVTLGKFQFKDIFQWCSDNDFKKHLVDYYIARETLAPALCSMLE